MRKTLLLFLSVLWCTAIFGQIQPVRIVSPTVEMQDGSQPLATNQPRFSWKYADNGSVNNVRQTSYRLIVASTEENARHNIGDLWDTKAVDSDQMLYIPYEGKTLESRDKAYWKVVTTVAYNGKEDKKGKNHSGASTST